MAKYGEKTQWAWRSGDISSGSSSIIDKQLIACVTSYIKNNNVARSVAAVIMAAYGVAKQVAANQRQSGRRISANAYDDMTTVGDV